jgi:hypothetical protein
MTTYDRILCEIVFDVALRDVRKKADLTSSTLGFKSPKEHKPCGDILPLEKQTVK